MLTATRIKILIFVCMLCAAALAAVLLSSQKPLPDGKRAELGGDFTLQSSTGSVALHDFRGKLVIMYFGYTSCQAVCPTSMQTIKNSLNRLPQDKMQQVQALLIGIDPERDSPARLASYTQMFHPNLRGITGTRDEVQRVARQYSAYFDKSAADNDAEGYLLEHVSRYYIIDRQGRLVDAMRHGTTVNELTARLKQLL